MTKSIFERTAKKRHKILIIEGANQTNQGNRSKSVYGNLGSLDELKAICTGAGEQFGVDIEIFVSNSHAAILEKIHESADKVDAFIINPAGFTVTGVAIVHALYETNKPYVEVHMANIEASPGHPRAVPIGPWDSAFTRHVTGVFMGLREYTYVGTILSLTLALDDPDFLGRDDWNVR